MRTWSKVTGSVVGAMPLLIAGCVNQLGSHEEELGHDHHEMTASAEDLLAGWTRDGEWLVSPVLDAPDGANRAGVLLGLTAPGDMPAVEARVMAPGLDGTWTALSETWGEEEQHVATADFADIGDQAQLRIPASAAGSIAILRWAAVVPEVAVEIEEDASSDVGGATEALRSELRGLGIVTREQWGARATRCTSTDSRKYRFAIHHTVTGSSDPARQMRGIQRFHMDTRGWCDVGYHFLIGQDGRVYEGRPVHLLGAHAGGQNTGNVGISFIGCFNSSGCGGLGPTRPNDASIRIAGRLVGTLRRLYGATVDSAHVKGHGQWPGQSTSCPGSNLRVRIPDIIAIGRTQTLSSSGTSSTGTTTTTSGGGGDSCVHTYGGRYSDGACSASYQCCDGAWRDRGACGGCACVETTGQTGCTTGSGGTTSSGPPPGDSCTHTFGGRYANTACSASYQCCDGDWRLRTNGCGTCFCTETTGERGCGL
jgi:hypothetical protein